MQKASDKSEKLINEFERAVAAEVAADARDASSAHLRKLGARIRETRRALQQHLNDLERAAPQPVACLRQE